MRGAILYSAMRPVVIVTQITPATHVKKGKSRSLTAVQRQAGFGMAIPIGLSGAL